jgi:hypothetical protein
VTLALDFNDNPVFVRLTHGAKWPSAQVTRWLAAGVGATSLALTIYLMTSGQEPPWNDTLATTLTILTWGLNVIVPLIAMTLAAIMTARAINDEGFQLLRATPRYSAGMAVRGLALAALYRLRVPLALMVTLTPLLAVRPYQEARRGATIGCTVFVSREEADSFIPNPGAAHLRCVDPSDIRLLSTSLVILLWPVGLWGIALFGTALAVGLTLWWRRAEWVWALSVGMPLCMLVILTLLGPVIGSVSYGGMFLMTVVVWPPPDLLPAAIWAAAFYPLAWGAMRLARRWA